VRTIIAGAASTALRDLLDGPPQPARVLAAFPAAIYLELPAPADPRVVAVVTADAMCPPNAITITAPLPPVRAGEPGWVGGSVVVAGGLRIAVRRWWRATLALGVVRGGLRLATGGIGIAEPVELAAACRTGDLGRAAVAAKRLVGLGPGLTPSGDDILAGLLVTLRVLGGAPEQALAGAIAEAVLPTAYDRTTALSATLLHCAARGQAGREVAAVLRGLTGAEPLGPAAARLRAAGHTSGADLIWGIALGTRSSRKAAA
jgi:hypothetical protein